MKRISAIAIMVATVMLIVPSLVMAATLPATVWFQGFEEDTDGWFDSTNGWFGSVERVASGTSGTTSSDGDFHAVMTDEPGGTGPFTRFDGYRDEWTGGFVASIDVYLDVDMTSGEGFEYSVAASGADGLHQRDFIFHVTQDSSTGQLLVGGTNNSNFAPREDLETINHYAVTESGWYTFQHVFRDNAGVLAVDLNLIDSNGTILFTETRSDPADTIPDEVGGNRYGWFTVIDVDGGIAVDNHQLVVTLEVTKESCKNGGWESFGFKNQGDCIQYVNTGK